MTGGGRWTFSQIVSSLAFLVWEWCCFEDIFTKDRWLNYLINQSMTKVFVDQPWLHRSLKSCKSQSINNYSAYEWKQPGCIWFIKLSYVSPYCKLLNQSWWPQIVSTWQIHRCESPLVTNLAKSKISIFSSNYYVKTLNCHISSTVRAFDLIPKLRARPKYQLSSGTKYTNVIQCDSRRCICQVETIWGHPDRSRSSQ